MRKYTATYFEWIDSVMKLPVWHTPKQVIEDSASERLNTVGYLIHETKNDYIIASSIHFNSAGEVVQFGQIFTIPKGCVTYKQQIKIIKK